MIRIPRDASRRRASSLPDAGVCRSTPAPGPEDRHGQDPADNAEGTLAAHQVPRPLAGMESIPPPGASPWQEKLEYDIAIHVFSISAGLVGVCLTAIGLLRIVISHTRVETLGDDFLAADAFLFMVCCILSFWTFKTRNPYRRRNINRAIDGLFLSALAMMVAICGLIAWAII